MTGPEDASGADTPAIAEEVGVVQCWMQALVAEGGRVERGPGSVGGGTSYPSGRERRAGTRLRGGATAAAHQPRRGARQQRVRLELEVLLQLGIGLVQRMHDW